MGGNRGIRWAVGVIGAATMLGALAPAVATAGWLEYSDQGTGSGSGSPAASIRYTALGPERNNVTLVYDPASTMLTIRDQGTLILPAVGDYTLSTLLSCTLLLDTAKCRIPAGRFHQVHVELGDGADVATAITPGVTPLMIAGDGGNDYLRIVSGSGVLAGGPGNDVLRAGAGDDQLFGGPGSDELTGGAGRDLVTWRHEALASYRTVWAAHDATAGVMVTLDQYAGDGQQGEYDYVNPDVEVLSGTPFNDAFVGDGDGESFLPSGGEDTVDGRGGDDRLVLRDGQADRYVCGDGNDAVQADGLDAFGILPFPVPTNDCESVSVL